MPPIEPPKAVAVEVVATQPTDADHDVIQHLAARDRKELPAVAYLVKVRCSQLPEPTATGWALYVGDERIPKYWAYPDGIYFKVFDRAFLAKHEGKPLRFSKNGTEFVETGLRLEQPKARLEEAERNLSALPAQTDSLK